MSSLRQGFDEIVADVPVYGDLDRAIEQAEKERRAYLGLVAGVAAAAAVVAVIVGTLVVTREGDDPAPIGPSPTMTETQVEATRETTAPANLPDNGRLARAEEVFARVVEPCTVITADYELADATADCIMSAPDVDARADTALLVERLVDAGDDPGTTLLVATRDAVVGRFPSPYEDFDAELGPGEREISLAQGLEITVVGFDGDERRVIDLSSDFSRPDENGFGQEIIGVEWSPDATRAAVTVRVTAEEGVSAQIWVFDRDGNEPELVHTATNTEQVPASMTPLAYLWSVTWSPDGASLAFIEEFAYIGGTEEAQSRRAATVTLTGSGGSVPRTLYDYDAGVYDEAAVVWSPDGTRVAVRTLDRVLELSATDGRVLARHPSIPGELTWLPK